MKVKHLAVLSIASLMMLASCTPTGGNSSSITPSEQPTTSQAPSSSAEGSSAASTTPSSSGTSEDSSSTGSSESDSQGTSSETESSESQGSSSEGESSEPEETITKIKDIEKGDVATIVGKVTTLVSDGCIVDDGTGTIHFQKVIADWAVGDIVKISGTFSVYYNDKQTGYGSSCTSADKVTDVAIERTLLDDAIELTAASYDEMAEGVTTPVAITFSATAKQNGKYTNFYVDDTSTHYMSPSKLKLPEGKEFVNGKFYQLTGYLTSYNTSAGYSPFYVVDFTEKAIAITDISVSAAGDKTSLTTGETIQLSATLTPTNTTQTDITWLSSDPDTASVDENGLVTSKKAGIVTITAKSSVNEAVGGSIQLTIADPIAHVSSISLDKTETTLMVGNDVTLVPTIEADEGATKAVNWTSDNEDVATVDGDGKVTAIGVGTAHIKVETVETNAEGNKLSAICTVTVDYESSTIEEMLDPDSGLKGKTIYRVSGILEGLNHADQYGNVYLTDPVSKKTITVYGLTGTDDNKVFNASAETDAKFFVNPKDAKTSLADVNNGEKVTLRVCWFLYNDTPEISGILESNETVTNKYSVKIDETENGTVTADKTEYSYGEAIKLTVTPAEGYKVDAVNYYNAQGTKTKLEVTDSGDYEVAATVSNRIEATFISVDAKSEIAAVTFGKEFTTDKSISGYTSTWTATRDGKTYSFSNWNNNYCYVGQKKDSNWTYIKAGREKFASVATFQTTFAFEEEVSQIVLTFNSFSKTDKCNSIKLYSSDTAFSATNAGVEECSITDKSVMKKGDLSLPVTNKAANKYYKVAFDFEIVGSNGSVALSKILFK